jgi:hypothetical protein
MSPPTPDQIAFLQSHLGVKLPVSYISLLMHSNGGCPQLDTFYDKTEGSCEEWAVDHFLHISSDKESTEDVLWHHKHLVRSGTAKEFVPIADDRFGNLICLDLTSQGNGQVIVSVHDDPDLPVVQVAESFEVFVDSLAPPPED